MASQFPPMPATVMIPTFTTPTKSGEIEVPGSSPFYYAGIQSLWMFWMAELKLLNEYLEPLSMKPYAFSVPGKEGLMGAVGLNFFNATALYGVGFPGNPGIGGFNETELNIVAYSSAVERAVPMGFTLDAFLLGADQTKRIGVYRVWVACDDAIAVAFGRAIYSENKFLTPYSYSVPALNNPAATTYAWTCYESADDPKNPIDIYTGAVDLNGLHSRLGNPCEWIDLSYVQAQSRVAASRRSYYATPITYLAQAGLASAVKITFGNSDLPMRRDMEKLIGLQPAVAIQQYTSPTVIAEAQPYWADL